MVNFNRNLIGYGYEFEGIEGEGVGDTVIDIGGVSLLGVTNGGVAVYVAVWFNWLGHECVRSDCFNGSNNSNKLPFNSSDDGKSAPISIKFGSSVCAWFDVKPFFFERERLNR